MTETTDVNGYALTDLHAQVFSTYGNCTASFIRRKVDEVQTYLDSSPDALIYLSIGENCGPAMRMRDAGLPLLGDSFFDFLVCPTESFIKIVTQDFADMLSLAQMSISDWEGHDSVRDDRYGILYHHVFHLNPEAKEKCRVINGIRRRTIDEADIPLFLAQVRSQFEYLAIKFRLILRSPLRKVLVTRRVEGEPFPQDQTRRMDQALAGFGAKNHEIIFVHSKPLGNTVERPDPRHRLIPQHQERWGDTDDWRALGQPPADRL